MTTKNLTTYATIIMPNCEVQSDAELNILFDSVEGQILNNRYKIGKFLDEGKCGKVYLIKDKKNHQKNAPSLVVKVHPSNELFDQEIQTMQRISESSSKAATPQVFEHS